MNLEEHLKENCSMQLPGLLSFGIKETYNEFHKFIEETPMFQTFAMNQTKGYILKGMIDLTLPRILSNSNIEHQIREESTCKFKNGHTYFVADVKGATITPKKLSSAKSFPRKANYRTTLAVTNKDFSLFDDAPEFQNPEFVYDPDLSPFLLLTYGGSAQQLKWINLSLPDFEMKRWIDRVDITNAPVLLSNKRQIKEEIHLTFTDNAARLIEEGQENERGKIV
ncbi:hypothetical protein [Lactococcus garvieae]|uniref:hypothetical protein n=1 Tax=Lactococcus garvieae TaxID=1363 RepID=UPI0002EBD634|nr:hypothetical protein [Lactococcus garvieae]